MQAVVEDLRYALRTLVKSVRVTALTVLSLALGLGASMAIFNLVHAVLLRPLPYRDAGRLTLVWESNPQKGVPAAAVSPANFSDFRDQNSVFEAMAAFEPANLALTGAGEPEQVRGLLVSEGFFGVLGVQPALGRDFLPSETKPGGVEAVAGIPAWWAGHSRSTAGAAPWPASCRWALSFPTGGWNCGCRWASAPKS